MGPFDSDWFVLLWSEKRFEVTEEEEEEEEEEGKRGVFLSTVEDCKNTRPEIKSSSGTELPISQHHTPKSIVQPITKSDAS